MDDFPQLNLPKLNELYKSLQDNLRRVYKMYTYLNLQIDSNKLKKCKMKIKKMTKMNT